MKRRLDGCVAYMLETRVISDRECGCSGCRNVIASIVMSMLAQLVSRGKIASLSHSLRHRLVRRPA